MGEVEKKMRKILSAVAVAFLLAGCSGSVVERVEEAPRLIASCPDPDTRRMLTDGATFRDLAVSRQEALRGWRQCSDAVGILQE
jgi:PBP1b-binding outer membrane lipoprotein LpoB